jgi:RNA polymerase sigma-70 factor (ECF subfamily)
VDDHDRQAERFEAHRGHLRAVAYRMLGSGAEADDAVQEAWLRYSRADTGDVENLRGWLTRVVARVCLDMLRTRMSRREEPLGSEPVGPAATVRGAAAPEDEAELADSVGVALGVVLDRLSPPERVTFVLHDLFALPFADIAPIVERSPVATKKLASRARHRVGAPPSDDPDLAGDRRLVEAFLAAARGGDVDALLTLLAPDVVRRADRVALPAGGAAELRGRRAVAEETRTFAAAARLASVALVEGGVGLLYAPRGRLRLAIVLTIDAGRITEIDVVADPDRLSYLHVAPLPR